MRLTEFEALTFDCYGTLIDWETGIIDALEPLTRQVERGLTRDEILQAHARHEASQQRYTETKLYRDVLAVVYRRLAEEWGVTVAHDACAAYGRSITDWPAFADSADALQYLKHHYKLVVLSNVDNESFQHSQRRLGVAFDAVYTAEDIGSYKPNLRNFEYMIDKLASLGVRRSAILHTAESLFHDHEPANALGLRSCWIHRRHAEAGYGATMRPDRMPRVDFTFDSLADLVKAHQLGRRAEGNRDQRGAGR